MSAEITVLHDGTFDLATGRSRRELNWKNRQTTWSDLLKKLSKTHRTAETYGEYMSEKRPRQDEIKDIGGFVGGYLSKGRRKLGSAVHRQLITLDIDKARPGLWEAFTMLYGCAACVYSTHKHNAESPRLRLVIPLNREVFSDEYIAIARRIAGYAGIEMFDNTGFQPERLMYWPSTSKDGVFEFNYQDGPWLDADAILSTYRDPRDSSEWPVSERHSAALSREIKKQGDPLEKQGVVGAWCRTYAIAEVIEKYLSDVYEPTDDENRFTYRHGSTAAGLIVYDNKYAFSHHGTDPCSGKLCNSFDLVRIHKYGLKDEDAREGTKVTEFPSYKEMLTLATSDMEVKKTIGAERIAAAKYVFDDGFEAEEDDGFEAEEDDGFTAIVHGEKLNSEQWKDRDREIREAETFAAKLPEEDPDWQGKMDIDKRKMYLSTINNVVLILRNDPNLKGRIAFNAFEKREIVLNNLPWRKVTQESSFWEDDDDAALRHYIETNYPGISVAAKIKDGLAVVIRDNSFHPVRSYLGNLKWDGTPRAERLLIDFLGAEDSEYTRTVTRKWLTAAVARIHDPGCKMDYALITVGEEGKKKSEIPQRLGGKWYSDSFYTVHGKEAYEQLQGVWIMEMAELSGFRNAEVEAIKHFISKRDDRYRLSYARRVTNNARQCVFYGTTNREDFLKGKNGNRKFWPVPISKTVPIYDVMTDLTREVVNQVWAECVQLYHSGETLYLSKELELTAKEMQIEHEEKDDRSGIIEQYLNKLLPKGWDEMTIYDRREFLRGEETLLKGTEQRSRVCVPEIWAEVFGGQHKELTRSIAIDLHNIMRRMPGWEEFKSKTDFKLYGTQRAYKRKAVTANIVFPGVDLSCLN